MQEEEVEMEMGDVSASAAINPTNEQKKKKKSSTSMFLQIVEQPDGSVTKPTVPNLPPISDDPNSPVWSKDIPLNTTNNTKLRLYLPISHNNNKKLPVIVYYHGGGFILFSPDFLFYHQFCNQMADALPALVVSLDYRLAPDHRLPAAYDDAVEAIHWLRQSTDPWIVDHGDLSRCYVMGSSSGGNMAYFAGLRAAKLDLSPVKLLGLVLIQPYFGGEERTQSEVESEEDDILPLRANELMWKLALPVGANRDHEYCNPTTESKQVDENIAMMPRTVVMGCRGDPLFDRQKVFVKMLQKKGVTLVDRLEEEEKGYHAIELFDAGRGQAMFAQIKEFVCAA